MLEYQVDENLYKTLAEGSRLGTSSHRSVRSDKGLWDISKGNFWGVGSVIFEENNQYRVITHFMTGHSFDAETTEKLVGLVTPKVSSGKESADLIQGQFSKDRIKINCGISVTMRRSAADVVKEIMTNDVAAAGRVASFIDSAAVVGIFHDAM